MLLPAIILGALALVALAVLVLGLKMRGHMSQAGCEKVERAWASVTRHADPVRRILEADKVLDLALSELGYQGSLGEKLKKAGPRIKHLNDVWWAHKLRNTIAHEVHASLSGNDEERALMIFQQAIRSLMK